MLYQASLLHSTPFALASASPAADDFAIHKSRFLFSFSLTGSDACIPIETRSARESCSLDSVCLLPLLHSTYTQGLHTLSPGRGFESVVEEEQCITYSAPAIESEAWDERHVSLFPLLVSLSDITMAAVSGQGFRQRSFFFSFHSLFTREAVAFVS